MSPAIRRIWTGCRFPHVQRVPSLEMLLVVSEVVSVVAFPELRLQFLFLAFVVLPRLLSLLASHAFVLRQIELFPSTLSLGMVLLLPSSWCRDHLADFHRDGFTVAANLQ